MIEEFQENCVKLDLKNKALNHCELILTNNSREELNIETFFDVHMKFNSYALIVSALNNPIIRTRIDIFNNEVIIGYFDLETDINGDFLDEYFIIK